MAGDDILIRSLDEWLAADNLLVFSRTAILTAAISAEAYANFYMAARLPEADADALDRLPVLDKLVTGVRLVAGKELFTRGQVPLQDLALLFRARNAIAHPKPGRVSADTAALIEPATAARSIVAVSEMALALAMTCGRDAEPFLARTPVVVLEHREYLLELGRRAAKDIPERHDPPPLALAGDEAPTSTLGSYLESTGWRAVTEDERYGVYGPDDDYGVGDDYYEDDEYDEDDDQDLDDEDETEPQTS